MHLTLQRESSKVTSMIWLLFLIYAQCVLCLSLMWVFDRRSLVDQVEFWRKQAESKAEEKA